MNKSIQSGFIRRREFFKKSSLAGMGVLVMGMGENSWGTNTSNAAEKDKSIPGSSYEADKNSSLSHYISALPVIDTHEHISSEAELPGFYRNDPKRKFDRRGCKKNCKGLIL